MLEIRHGLLWSEKKDVLQDDAVSRRSDVKDNADKGKSDMKRKRISSENLEISRRNSVEVIRYGY